MNNEPSPEAKQFVAAVLNDLCDGIYLQLDGENQDTLVRMFDAATAKLREELEEIAKERDEWRTKAESLRDTTQARAPLAEALEFYANPENWVNDVLGMPDGSTSKVEGSSQINQDSGMLARAALLGTFKGQPNHDN